MLSNSRNFLITTGSNEYEKVDGNKVPYERINNGFLGFPITKGTHDIEIEYKVPYKKLGITITLVGLILYAVVTILEYKRKF